MPSPTTSSSTPACTTSGASTCLLDVVPIDHILFGSEMIGAVRGIDPATGHHYDDTKRYVDASSLGDSDRQLVFEGNARRVYPRLDARLAVRP